MPRRRIGQEMLFQDAPTRSSLDEIGALIDWAPVEAALDGRSGHLALADDPGDVFADSACRGQAFAGAVRAKGGTLRVVATSVWAKNDPISQEAAKRRRADWNGAIQRVRGRIEKIFGTWKRSCGFRRMRWRGLAKARLQTHLTAIAYNIGRTTNILRPV